MKPDAISFVEAARFSTLEHALFKRRPKQKSALLGTTKPNHKYLKRIQIGKKGEYKYLYTQEEVDAYNKNIASKNVPKSSTRTDPKKSLKLSKSESKLFDKLKNAAKNICDKAIKQPLQKVKNIVTNASDRAKSFVEQRRAIKITDIKSGKIGSTVLTAVATVAVATGIAAALAAAYIGVSVGVSALVNAAARTIRNVRRKKAAKRGSYDVPLTNGMYIVDAFREYTDDAGHSADTLQLSETRSVHVNTPSIDKNQAVDNALLKKDSDSSVEEDQAATNPNYKKSLKAYDELVSLVNSVDTYGKNVGPLVEQKAAELMQEYTAYTGNCMWCTTTYDLRRRGYDVTAAPATSANYNGDYAEMYDYYENPILLIPEPGASASVSKKIAKETSAYGDGAYGNLMVYWGKEYGGGGHSMVWSVENGSTVIRDAQSNETYPLEYILAHVDCNTPGNIVVCRTDNLVLKKEILEVVER